MNTLQRIPRLASLHTRPSWHNRAGRPDRSACFVITAAQLWRTIPDEQWTYRYPARQPADAAKGKCDRWAELRLCARDLWELHRGQPPCPLRGDRRSAKSNAMRPQKQGRPQGRPFNGRARPTFADRNRPANTTARPADTQSDTQSVEPPKTADTVRGFDADPINPNRGVGFRMHKMLGLPAEWETTLRIERIVQHHKLRQHFLVCPVCGPRNEVAAGQRPGVVPSDTHHAGSPPARCAAATKPSLPGRVTKLYLPLCTPREYEDAQRAHLWLQSHPHNTTHPNRPLSPEAAALIERYAELFPHRQLRCRQCLGLRYGEVKQ